MRKLYRNRRTCSYTKESHMNTKLNVIRCMQRTCKVKCKNEEERVVGETQQNNMRLRTFRDVK